MKVPLKKKIKQKVWSIPSLYFSLLRFISFFSSAGIPVEKLLPRGAFRTDRIISNETEIVIEGFDRSGNTYAWLAFEQAQNRKVRIAHHLHVPAQIIRAVSLRIPAIVLIRDPLDCVVSDLLRGGNLSKDSLICRLKDWVDFYSSIFSKKEGFIMAPFEAVTNDFGAVISKVNEKFGSEFNVFVSTKENVDAVFAAVERAEAEAVTAGESKMANSEFGVGRPSQMRSNFKKEFLCKIKDDPEVMLEVNKASKLYREFLEYKD